MAKIKVKNRKTGVVSEFTTEQWEKTKADPIWSGVFVEIPAPKVPDEVKELADKKASTKENSTQTK